MTRDCVLLYDQAAEESMIEAVLVATSTTNLGTMLCRNENERLICRSVCGYRHDRKDSEKPREFTGGRTCKLAMLQDTRSIIAM